MSINDHQNSIGITPVFNFTSKNNELTNETQQKELWCIMFTDYAILIYKSTEVLLNGEMMKTKMNMMIYAIIQYHRTNTKINIYPKLF